MAFLSPIEKIAIDLFEVGAILGKRQPPDGNGKGFKLKLHEQNPEAPLSPIYFNFRTQDNPKPGPLTQEIVSAIGQQLYYRARDLKLKYNYVAGVPNAGDPFAEAFLSSMTQHPSNPVEILKLKKEEKRERRKITEILDKNGCVSPGKTVLLLDDIITKADSKFETIIVLREKGLIVRDVIVFLDREQGGANELKSLGYNLYSIFTLTQLFNFYLKKEMVSQTMFDEITSYLRSNN